MQKLLYNGKFYTVDKNNPWADSVLIENSIIIFCGEYSQIIDKISKDCVKIDLKGSFGLPGFIDNHTHLVQGAIYLNSINLRECKNKIDFRKQIQEYARNCRKGDWIIGGDWDHFTWEEKDLPDIKLIDDITSDNPVFLTRLDGHLCLVNSLALKIFNIDKKSSDPVGGIICKDLRTGELTGILKDNAMFNAAKLIPSIPNEQLLKYLENALTELKRNGITSIHDISSLEDLNLYKTLESNKNLTCKIYSRLPIKEYSTYSQRGILSESFSKNIKCGSLKAFADGSIGSQTAWFFEPYENSEHYGLPMDIVMSGELRSWALQADDLKYNLSIHAIGDRAISEVLDIYAEIEKSNIKWDRRFRIEHAQHIHPKDIIRFNQLNVFASMQPYHLYLDGAWVEDFIGTKRAKTTYAFRSFLDSKIILGFGSDWTVAPLNPLLGIYAAVTRNIKGKYLKDGWYPEEKISVKEAIEAYTINNAWAEYSENSKGSIAVGKDADIIILDKNLFTINEDDIPNAKVIMTIFNGEIIFDGTNI